MVSVLFFWTYFALASSANNARDRPAKWYFFVSLEPKKMDGLKSSSSQMIEYSTTSIEYQLTKCPLRPKIIHKFTSAFRFQYTYIENLCLPYFLQKMHSLFSYVTGEVVLRRNHTILQCNSNCYCKWFCFYAMHCDPFINTRGTWMCIYGGAMKPLQSSRRHQRRN